MFTSLGWRSGRQNQRSSWGLWRSGVRGRTSRPERRLRLEAVLAGQLVGKEPGESISRRRSPGGRL